MQKRMGKTSEIGQILMSIDNLYKKCIERETNSKNAGIKYQVSNESAHPKDFNDVKIRGEYAVQQLTKIKDHLRDFKKLIDDVNLALKKEKKS